MMKTFSSCDQYFLERSHCKLFQMNLGLYSSEYDGDSRYNMDFLKSFYHFPRFGDNARGLDDSRLLDAAETLVTLQTSGVK